MARLQNADFSTIDIDRLRKLPVWDLPPSRKLQDDSGNACFLDAPGFPTYFTRSVYNLGGNNPGSGPEMVITFEGKHYVVESVDNSSGWDSTVAKRKALLMSLWKPLPVDHERVQEWMKAVYSHMQHCYTDALGLFPAEYGKPATVISPVPYYNLKTFTDDIRFNDDWREKEKASVEAFNANIRELTARVAWPENHNAVRSIREFYPDHQPILEYINKPPQSGGNWWEVLSKRPTPESCPGQYGHAHPVNGKWCQMCGWHEEAA